MRKEIYKGRRILKEQKKVFKKEVKEIKENNAEIAKEKDDFKREEELLRKNLGIEEEKQPEESGKKQKKMILVS